MVLLKVALCKALRYFYDYYSPASVVWPILQSLFWGLFYQDEGQKFHNWLPLLGCVSFLPNVAINCVRWILSWFPQPTEYTSQSYEVTITGLFAHVFQWLWDNVGILVFINGLVVLGYHYRSYVNDSERRSEGVFQ